MRFRRRVRVFPGLTLNFSGSGISATVGVPGLSVNMGRQGTFLNTGLPGTGLYNRQRIGARPPGNRSGSRSTTSARSNSSSRTGFNAAGSGSASTSHNPSPAEPAQLPGSAYVPYASEKTIGSAPMSALRSAGLEPLREQLEACYRERRELLQLHSQAEQELERWRKRRSLARWLLLGWVMPVFTRKINEAEEDRDALREQINACAVDLQCQHSPEMETAYQSLCQAFDGLARSGTIWDVTGEVPLDNTLTRTPQDTFTRRFAVQWKRTPLSILRCAHEALLVENANGEDILIYPGFFLLFNEEREFALIDLRELELQLDLVRFIEEGPVPPDARVVDHTWTRVNKDGSPDRRFRDNPRLPICLYVRLTWRSQGGLHETYLCTDGISAADFMGAFAEYQQLMPPWPVSETGPEQPA
jgi:hypothetical protein